MKISAKTVTTINKPSIPITKKTPIKLPHITLPHLSLPKVGKKKKAVKPAKPVKTKNVKAVVTKDINDDTLDVDEVETHTEAQDAEIITGKVSTKRKRKVKSEGLEAARIVAVRKQLKFPANLISDKELSLMLKMDTPVTRIRRILNKRFTLSLLTAVLGLIMAVLLSQHFIYILLVTWCLAGLMWYFNVKNTSDYYLMYSIARQIAFTTFTRIAGALLPDLANGSNLLSVFDKVSKSMKDENDKIALQKLMIRMSNDKNNVEPFLEFAHKFSTTDKAELVMINMHQMYLGNTDTSGLQSLIDDTNKDYQEQTRRIIEMKMHKFMMTTTKIAVSAIIVLFGYFGIYTFSLVANIMHMMQNVKF